MTADTKPDYRALLAAYGDACFDALYFDTQSPPKPAWLTDGSLRDCDLRGLRLVEVNLGGAVMVECDLRGCDLQHAWLGDASLRNCDLRGCDLTGASAKGASLVGCDMRGCDTDRLDTTDADMTGVQR